MNDQQKPQSHWHEALALTMGMLLLVALTAYVGAATTPVEIFAQEEDGGPSADEIRQLKENKQWFKDNLKNTVQQYKDLSRQLRSKSQGPESDIVRLTKELQQILRSSNIKKLPADYRVDVEKQGKELLDELQGLATKIKDAKQQAKTTFDTLAPLYQKVAAINVNAINDLDTFEDAKSNQEELQQEMSALQNDTNDAGQDFYGGEYWQKKDRIRTLIELPRQLTDFEKTLARSVKLTTSKSLLKLEQFYQGTFTVATLKERVKLFQEQVKGIQTALKSGDVEDLQGQIQELNDARIHDLEGAINRLKEFGDLLPGLMKTKALKDAKNEELRTIINETATALIARVTEGDLENIHQDFQQFINGMDEWPGLYALRDKLGQKYYFNEDDPRLNRLREFGKKFDQNQGQYDDGATPEASEAPMLPEYQPGEKPF